MKVLKLTTGPVGTNVWIVGDVRTREAIAIDTATPSVHWLTQQLGDEVIGHGAGGVVDDGEAVGVGLTVGVGVGQTPASSSSSCSIRNGGVSRSSICPDFTDQMNIADLLADQQLQRDSLFQRLGYSRAFRLRRERYLALHRRW